MLNDDYDLCRIMIEEMRRMQFKETSIAYVQNSDSFVTASTVGQPNLQRSHLTMLISRIFTMGPEVVPYQIRLGLTMADDTMSWIRDLKILLIPFLKENEDKFFPV